MSKKDESVILVDVFNADGERVRTGIKFTDAPGITAKEQAREFAAAQKASGRTCKARLPK